MPYIDNISVAGQTYELKDTTGTFIAPQEVSPAEAAHAAGDYLVYNGTLYQVSAAISVGDALTAGTNITAVPDGIGGDVADLKSQISDVESALISTSTEKQLNHENVLLPSEITFYGNEYAFSNACYADGKNYLKGTNESGEFNGVTYTGNGLFRVVNGTPSATNDKQIYSEFLSLPAGSYVLKMVVDSGNSAITTSKNGNVYFRYTDNTQLSATYSTNGNSIDMPVELSKELKSFRVTFGYRQTSSYDGYKIWFGLFDASTNFFDTEVTVPSDGNVVYAPISSVKTINTMQHESVIKTIVDTKTYVDRHIPADMLTESDLVYITPEMYGAVGDGIADDTATIQACIDAATNAGSSYSGRATPIRGYGNYLITSSLSITGRQHNIYLHYIKYTGSDAAVIAQCTYSKIVFGSIYTNSGDSAACAIRAQERFTQNDLQLMYAACNGNVIEFLKDDNTSGNFFYNRITVQQAISYNANIFYFKTLIDPNETNFYGSSVTAPNGYLAYFDHENGYSSGNKTMRFYGFCFEEAANCIFGNAQLIDVRLVEGQNKQTQTDRTKGVVFNFNGVRPSGTVIGASGTIDYTSVKIDNALSYQEALQLTKDALDAGAGITDVADILGCHSSYVLIGICNRVANANLSGTGSQIFSGMGRLYAYWNHLAFKPSETWYHAVTEQTFNAGARNTLNFDYIWPTVFDLNASSTINLDDSYCCIAINDVTVIQRTGNEAIIYGKDNNVIFDGTGKGPGVYHLKCVFDPLESIAITLTDGTVRTLNKEYVRNIYTGANEHWIVTKEELIE